MNSLNNCPPPLPEQQIIDLNLHGIVRIRLINAAPNTAAALTRRFATALLPPDNRDPDIVIRFLKNISPPYLKFVGSNSAGFTDKEFYLLDKLTGQVVAQVPVESIGGRCEISCRRGTGTMPLLFHIINITFLRKNYVPLHSSAFVYEGVGVLVMGWPKGGKTGALLSFMSRGARYIGDEWVMISSDGQKMLGIPAPVSISEWQLEHIPQMIPEVSLQQQLMFKSIHMLEVMYGVFGRSKKLKQSYFSKMLKKSLPAFRRQLRISKAPQRIFKDQMDHHQAIPEKLLLITGHSEPEISIHPCDPLDVARRMVQANVYEMRDFFEFYGAFKFAFPQKRNEFLESISELQELLLIQAWSGKEAYHIFHPYGGSLQDLFDHIKPLLQSKEFAV